MQFRYDHPSPSSPNSSFLVHGTIVVAHQLKRERDDENRDSLSLFDKARRLGSSGVASPIRTPLLRPCGPVPSRSVLPYSLDHATEAFHLTAGSTHGLIEGAALSALQRALNWPHEADYFHFMYGIFGVQPVGNTRSSTASSSCVSPYVSTLRPDGWEMGIVSITIVDWLSAMSLFNVNNASDLARAVGAALPSPLLETKSCGGSASLEATSRNEEHSTRGAPACAFTNYMTFHRFVFDLMLAHTRAEQSSHRAAALADSGHPPHVPRRPTVRRGRDDEQLCPSFGGTQLQPCPSLMATPSAAELRHRPWFRQLPRETASRCLSITLGSTFELVQPFCTFLQRKGFGAINADEWMLLLVYCRKVAELYRTTRNSALMISDSSASSPLTGEEQPPASLFRDVGYWPSKFEAFAAYSRASHIPYLPELEAARTDSGD